MERRRRSTYGFHPDGFNPDWSAPGFFPPLEHIRGKGGSAPSPHLDVPATIPDLVDWHRSDLGITLVGSKVSAWADQSGNGHNLSQGTDANRPTYVSGVIGGHAVARFGPTAGDLSLVWTPWAAPSVATVYMVVRMRTSAAYQLAVLMTGTKVNALYLEATGNDKPSVFDAAVDRAVWSTALVDTTSYLVKWAWDVSSNPCLYYTQVGGATEVPESVATTGTAGNFSSIGLSPTGQDLISDIAEIAIYKRKLASSEHALVLDYIRARYGV